MSAVVIGPIALPINPLLLLLAFGFTMMVAKYVLRQSGAADLQAVISRRLYLAAAGGLICARLAYVADGAAAYLEQPWSVLNLRDGGWSLGWGLVGALVTLALLLGWAAWGKTGAQAQARVQAKAALIGTATGIGLWLMGSLPTGMWQQPALPQVTVQSLAGESRTLAQWADGRPLIVNVWATWCPPCRAEMPDLVRVQARLAAAVHQPQGLAKNQPQDHAQQAAVGNSAALTPKLLLVNQGEAAGVVEAYLRRDGLAAEGVMLDPTSAVGKATGTSGLPSTLFYDVQGRLIDRHFGPMSEASLLAKIKQLQRQP